MRFDPPLCPGRLVRRYKRFLADVELDDGTVVVAHCANPGSMATCLAPGGRVWLSHHPSPTRKLRWTWQLAEVAGSTVYLHPAGANELVAEALKARRIPELSGYDLLRREVRVGERSRIDLLLSGPGRCFIEVKNATLALERGRLGFPDSVTERGTRHLRELMLLRRSGARAVLFFCAARTGAVSVEPAAGIDPTYAATLRQAAAVGVEVLAYAVTASPHHVGLLRRVPVRL